MSTYYGYSKDGRLNSQRPANGPMGKNETTSPPPQESGPWYWHGREWKSEPPRARVGPVEFKLLFTSAERLKLKELRASDPALADFFEIIEDPRLQYIDLSLGSTAAGVDHCLSLLINAEIISESEGATRREQILSGTLL